MGNRRSRPTEQELDLEVKKHKFLHSLKKTYKLQYDAVQPIPYIKDRLYRVDKVFIEGGIEIYITEDDKWVGIKSYKSIFTDLRIKSTRRFIKAEAGYGKSTSTLQLAYDWCKGVKDSPLKDVDILILLRMRQLGGIASIYEAIKRLLVPDDQQIKSTDIKNIIESCTSVEILLDGYDEYPDQNSETGSDVERIITGEMFPEINVSITTRYIPKEFDKDITKHVKFTGFDNKAREKYILKAVTDSKRKVRKIKEALQANPILDDLCVVPLLFVMFAHMSHEEKEFLDCKSVTDFFRYMMKCFHSHMRNKRRNDNTEPYNSQFEIEHTELNEVAFEGLANENQQLSWDKNMLCKRLGRGLYNHYLALGLLVEEMVVVMSEKHRQEEDTIIEVHFYHKLFCEWFAAFRLVKIVAATEDAAKVKEVLDKIDPFDLQYLFRFSCGIDSKVSSKIVTYLKRRKDCRNFAILCIMEQTGELDEDIKGTVTEICSEETKLQTSDSKLLQRSTIQVLDIASRTEIAVSCLSLDTCFTSADQSEITLESGLRVPNLSSLEQLEIKEKKGKIFTPEEILGAIRYGIECHNLKKISFIDCVLPLFFDSKSLIPTMKTQKLTVSLKLLDMEFHLDISSGKWIEFLSASFDDRHSLQQMCSKPIVLQSEEVNQHQPSLIMILKIASSHNFAISCLKLNKCFSGADQNEITLESGLLVPNLSSLEQLEIKEKNGKIFTAEQILGAIRYGNECQNLTKISFIDCVLPLSFDSKALIPEIKTQKLTVTWKPLDCEFYLDLSSGKWIDCLPTSFDDQLSLQQMCSEPIVLQSKEVNQHQPSLMIMILKIASSHNIAVSCLNLEKCFTGADQSGITLESGTRVPNLSSLERLEIKEKKGKIFTTEEILGAIRYGMECHNLTNIMFTDCVLPLSFDSKSLIPAMKTQKLIVSWKPLDCEFHLDLSSGKWRDFLPALTKCQHSLQRLCSRTVSLRKTDSKQLQKSTILLLEIASSHNIPISDLFLKWSFSGFDGEDIRLESGLSLSSLSSVEKISINEGRQNQELTEEEVIGLINYGLKSPIFKELWLRNCKLPLSINPDIIPEESRSRNIKVISSKEAVLLHLATGTWRMLDDIQTITEICSDALVIHRDTSESVQRSVIELLVEASNHDIPIIQVDLAGSFSKIDEDGNIILSSGLSLPIITSMENMGIQTEKGREMNKHEVNGILNYVQHSQRFKELELTDCLLPSSIPVGPSLSTLKSREVDVVWTPDSDKNDEDYWLDLDSGRWEKEGTW